MTVQTDDEWVPEDTLANRLVLVRRHLGITQRAAAERCGLTFGEWQGIEDGRRVRGLDVKVAAISRELGVSRDWLMWGGRLAEAQVNPRDLPHRRRTPATAGRPDLGKPVNERYLAAIIHSSERRSSRDEWRIRELRGSHELPILARRHGHNLRICRKVAA